MTNIKKIQLFNQTNHVLNVILEIKSGSYTYFGRHASLNNLTFQVERIENILLTGNIHSIRNSSISGYFKESQFKTNSISFDEFKKIKKPKIVLLNYEKEAEKLTKEYYDKLDRKEKEFKELVDIIMQLSAPKKIVSTKKTLLEKIKYICNL